MDTPPHNPDLRQLSSIHQADRLRQMGIEPPSNDHGNYDEKSGRHTLAEPLASTTCLTHYWRGQTCDHQLSSTSGTKTCFEMTRKRDLSPTESTQSPERIFGCSESLTGATGAR